MNQTDENVQHHTFRSTVYFHYAVAQTNNSHENASIKLLVLQAKENFHEIKADVGDFRCLPLSMIKVHAHEKEAR